MISTAPSQDIGDFLAFLGQVMGRAAVEQRVGASASDIERFAELAGLPLPPLYVGYLREFGRSDGELQMADDAFASVDQLIAYYEEEANDPTPAIPPGGVLIGVRGVSGDRALLYPAPAPAGTAPVGPGEPRVVVSWWGDVGDSCARDFADYLYRQAFVRGAFRDGLRLSMNRLDTTLVPAVRDVAETLGFEAYWFSDEYQACLERDDGTALYAQRGHDRTTLFIRAESPAARDFLVDAFARRLGLKVSSSSS